MFAFNVFPIYGLMVGVNTKDEEFEMDDEKVDVFIVQFLFLIVGISLIFYVEDSRKKK
jgi:hypothetical protein|tara:strand:+ start:3844 stop:4017 length:174 start_codon:yes stop_codon:yes gene_type:complete